VEIIETNNRKYYYPFDIPTKQEHPKFLNQELPLVVKYTLGAVACGAVCYLSIILFLLLIVETEAGM